jgi:hypothetical protein
MVLGIAKRALLCAAFLQLSNCGRVDSSATKDLNPGPDSNIAVPGLAKVVQVSDIESLKVLPNTHIPKGMVVYLVGNQNDRFNNWQFVVDLYREVHTINTVNALEPTVGKANPSEADLRNQEVTLVVMVEKGAAAKYKKLVDIIDVTMSLELGAQYDGKLFLSVMETTTTTGADLWIQDFGEFASAKLKGQAEPVYMVLDTNRNKNRKVYDPISFTNAFGIPLVYMGENVDNSAQYGGNIEATPDGVLYMGDSVDSGDYSGSGQPTKILEDLRALGNTNAVKIESDWLAVGHVDEYLTFVPSKGSCDSTMVYGSPLLALQTMLEVASKAEYDLFAEELATLPIGYDKNDKPLTLNLTVTPDKLRAALAKFLKVPGTGNVSTNIQDYDLSKVNRAVATIGSGSMLTYDVMMRFLGDVDLFTELYVWRNLLAEVSILDSKDKLLAVESCKQAEVIPQAFLPNMYVDGVYNQGLWTKDSVHLPGMTNAIVLRDHVIFPDPWVQSMRDAVKSTLDKHIGADKVHFVDDAIYHFALGEVHCATNVIREPKLDFQY